MLNRMHLSPGMIKSLDTSQGDIPGKSRLDIGMMRIDTSIGVARDKEENPLQM